MPFYQFINHDKGFIASFSPKCACNTLKWWFADSLAEEIVDEQQLNKYRVGAKALEVHPHYLKLLFVRNPHERLVSFYCRFIVNYTLEWGFADHDKNIDLKERSFSEFVQLLVDLKSRGHRFQHHLEPQLEGVDQQLIDRVIPVDFLDEQLVGIGRELGFAYLPKHLNATDYSPRIQEPVMDKRPDWLRSRGVPHSAHFYNEKLRAIVNRIYAEDLQCYEAALAR